MLLTADLSSVSVIVMSSTYLWVRQPGRIASIKIQDDKRQWAEIGPLWQRRQLQPVRQDVADLHPLSSVSQKCAHPPHNDIRQTQRNQLVDENVVVDVIKNALEKSTKTVRTD